MFTRLFVQNPIFTNVIAIIAVYSGHRVADAPSHSVVSRHHPADDRRFRQLSRADRGNRGQDRRAPIELQSTAWKT